MDDLNLANDDLRRNLDELEVINYWLGGNLVITNALNHLVRQQKIDPNTLIHMADLGSGGGDVLRLMAQWGRKKGIPMVLTGIDANDFMLGYATEKTKQFPEIQFVKQDIFAPDFEVKSCDWVTCSLFCHHFTDEQLISLFHKLHQETRSGFIINDIHRHPLAYYSIWILTRLFNGSYLVKHDAPLSVKRAFKRKELVALLQKAGIKHFKIRWLWAFRWQVIVWR